MTYHLLLNQLAIEENIQVVASPAWHQTILQARKNALLINEEAFMDWELAKQNIAARVAIVWRGSR